MTRNEDTGEWIISGRELRTAVFLVPLMTAVFSAGASWMGVTMGLDRKVDKSEYELHTRTEEVRYQVLRVQDSLQLAAAHEDRQRLREIVCKAVQGCR